MEKAVDGMIGKTQHEIPREASGREKERPFGPLFAARRDHAVHQQQAAETHVGERSGKRGLVSQAAKCSLVEKVPVEMKNYASGTQGMDSQAIKAPRSDQSRRRCDPMRMNSPTARPAAASGEATPASNPNDCGTNSRH